MTTARRLAAVETSLTPTQRVVAWLDEAHAFGDLNMFAESLLDQPPEALPLNRLAREAALGVRSTMRGRSGEDVDRAVGKALRETLFRYHLVLRASVTAHEVIERDLLVHGLLAAQLALLVSEDRSTHLRTASYERRFSMVRDLAFRRVDDELLAWAEAPVPTSAERYGFRTRDVPDASGGLAVLWGDDDVRRRLRARRRRHATDDV